MGSVKESRYSGQISCMDDRYITDVLEELVSLPGIQIADRQPPTRMSLIKNSAYNFLKQNEHEPSYTIWYMAKLQNGGMDRLDSRIKKIKGVRENLYHKINMGVFEIWDNMPKPEKASGGG